MLPQGRLVEPASPTSQSDALLPLDSDHPNAVWGCPCALCRTSQAAQGLRGVGDRNSIFKCTTAVANGGGQHTTALQELTFCRHQPQALQNAKYYKSPWGSRAVTSEGKFSAWGNAFVCCGVTCDDAAQDNHTMPKLVLPKPAWPPQLVCSAHSPAASPAPEAHPCPVPQIQDAQATSWCPWQEAAKSPGRREGLDHGHPRWEVDHALAPCLLLPSCLCCDSPPASADDKSVLLCSRRAPVQRHSSFRVG